MGVRGRGFGHRGRTAGAYNSASKGGDAVAVLKRAAAFCRSSFTSSNFDICRFRGDAGGKFRPPGLLNYFLSPLKLLLILQHPINNRPAGAQTGKTITGTH
jgi:hypothetical protein